MAPPSDEYSNRRAFGLINATRLALCSSDRAIPIGLTIPLCEGPPHSRYSSPLDDILLKVLSDKSASFVGTVMFAVEFPLWFAVNVATVDPFFCTVSLPLLTSAISVFLAYVASAFALNVFKLFKD